MHIARREAEPPSKHSGFEVEVEEPDQVLSASLARIIALSEQEANNYSWRTGHCLDRS